MLYFHSACEKLDLDVGANYRNAGAPERRSAGAPGRWDAKARGRWSAGAPERKGAGTLERRGAGAQGRRGAGTLERPSDSPLVPLEHSRSHWNQIQGFSLDPRTPFAPNGFVGAGGLKLLASKRMATASRDTNYTPPLY